MAVIVHQDGRIERTEEDYKWLRRVVWELQEHRCIACGDPMELEDMHLHHKEGRAGGKRHDTPKDTEGRCFKCHDRKHQAGMRRVPKVLLPRIEKVRKAFGV